MIIFVLKPFNVKGAIPHRGVAPGKAVRDERSAIQTWG
jgi:hypothetical protein